MSSNLQHPCHPGFSGSAHINLGDQLLRVARKYLHPLQNRLLVDIFSPLTSQLCKIPAITGHRGRFTVTLLWWQQSLGQVDLHDLAAIWNNKATVKDTRKGTDMQTSLQIPDPEIYDICGSTNLKQFVFGFISFFFLERKHFSAKRLRSEQRMTVHFYHIL